MHITSALIGLAKQRLAIKHNLPLPMSDYRLAKLMELKQTTISSWNTGRSRIGTEFVRKFADACELSEEYVYACIEHERATPEVKGVLERIAKVFSGKAAAAILSVGCLWLGGAIMPSNQAHASVMINVLNQPDNIHYAKYFGDVLLRIPIHKTLCLMGLIEWLGLWLWLCWLLRRDLLQGAIECIR